MEPEHLYYKEVNAKDGAYYRRRVSVFGPNMAECVNRILKTPKHEEQAYMEEEPKKLQARFQKEKKELRGLPEMTGLFFDFGSI